MRGVGSCCVVGGGFERLACGRTGSGSDCEHSLSVLLLLLERRGRGGGGWVGGLHVVEQV